METTQTLMVSFWDQITVPQLIAWIASFGGALFTTYRFWLRKKLDTLKQNDEIALRYRQITEEHRIKFQSDVMAQMERMRQENIDLRQQLYSSEKEKMGLMQQVAQLQAEIITLREQVRRVTAEMIQLRGGHPNATHG